MWRSRDEGRSSSRWGDQQDSRWTDNRPRSPVWEANLERSVRSPQRERHYRDRYDRDRHDRDRYDRDREKDDSERDRDRRDRYDRDSDRHRDSARADNHDRESDRYARNRDRNDKARDRDRERERDRDRDRDRDRERRKSPRRHSDEEIPSAPSPPNISSEREKRSRSRSRSSSRDGVFDSQVATPGDWFCKCGSYNFKRRLTCYRRNCQETRAEGVIYGGDSEPIDTKVGISKQLLFKRLDALTTEEGILEALKERCSKSLIDSITGITIGRETLTGASKCLAYVNFNSVADSSAAHSELNNLKPPLIIDSREVLVRFYTEPQKQKPVTTSTDYVNYYAQMASYGTTTQALSEADRVNAAAAVAQSAISAAQARQMSWTPVSVPVFVGSTSQVKPVAKVPTGDGKTVYSAPDVRTFLYDETSGYYYDPATGLYYDGKTQYFYNSHTNQYMYWDATSSTYIAATQTQQNTDQPKLPNPPQATVDNTITKETEDKKKKDKEDKVKVAKKIAKDMERWARTLNQKKENARNNIVMEQPLDTGASKGSADIGFSVLGSRPALTHMIRELSPPPKPISGDDFLVKQVPEAVMDVDNDEGIIDWQKLTCLLCKRRFPTADVLNKHKVMSDLHKQNLVEFQKKNELLPQPNGYRDRAAERRMKFGEDDTPVRKRYEPPEVMPSPVQPHPPPSVVDTIGGKMLQKMGWSEGRGLGKDEQGRTAPIEAEQRRNLAGLGQKRGIYTPTPGETYRDTVKKLMIARYKEVVGQEDGSN